MAHHDAPSPACPKLRNPNARILCKNYRFPGNPNDMCASSLPTKEGDSLYSPLIIVPNYCSRPHLASRKLESIATWKKYPPLPY